MSAETNLQECVCVYLLFYCVCLGATWKLRGKRGSLREMECWRKIGAQPGPTPRQEAASEGQFPSERLILSVKGWTSAWDQQKIAPPPESTPPLRLKVIEKVKKIDKTREQAGKRQ